VNSIVDGHDWIWPLVLAGILVYYVRRNMRRAPDACREVTGADCALDIERAAREPATPNSQPTNQSPSLE